MHNSQLGGSWLPKEGQGRARPAPCLHSASHSSTGQDEAADCHLLALSQYFIAEQLWREKETVHLPITCL